MNELSEGDIVTIDCRPFHEPFNAVVTFFEEAPNAEAALMFFRDGKLRRNYYSLIDDATEQISPFYNCSINKKELPEEEKILKGVSRYVKKYKRDFEKSSDFLHRFNGEININELEKYLDEQESNGNV